MPETEQLEASSTEVLLQIKAMPEARRQRARDEFVVSRQRLFRTIAFRLCRNYGISPQEHMEDVTQVVAEEAIEWINKLMDDREDLTKVLNWEGMLHVRSKQTVRTWMDRNLTPASGMISVSRRVRMLNAVRDEMRQSMSDEPTKQQIVDEHNRRMRASRKDPERQGVIATVDDLIITGRSVNVDDHEQVGPMEDGCVLHPAEGPRFVQSVVEAAEELGGVTADVASTWLAGVYATEGYQQVLSVDEVAAALGIEKSVASTQIRKVKALARKVLIEQLGIAKT